MKAATQPVQRPADAKLLNMRHRTRSEFAHLLRPGDVVIANDAATLPASLVGYHSGTGLRIEVRLAGRESLAPDKVKLFLAIVFGEGDFRTRTEERKPPPPLRAGDRVELGPLRATIVRVLDHPRLVSIEFEGLPREIWHGLARHGRPIQYAHIGIPLSIWDTWTPVAGPPVAFEPPSAGFVLDWELLETMKQRGVQFGTITHAAGISSTGDPSLDALLPFDEPYRIPISTATLIQRARTQGGHVIAIGTTVVRALEHAANLDGVVRAGEGVATQKIGPGTLLRVVDAFLSGTHEPGTSHYELLRAFVDDDTLHRADQELDAHNYRTHEFGDSVFISAAPTYDALQLGNSERLLTA